jgi:phage-related protein
MAARSSAPEGNKDTPTRTANRENAQQATQARRSAQDAGNSRLAENVPSDQTVPEQVYADYAQNYDEDDAALNGKIPDVLLDAPVVSIKGLDFELDDLRAKVSLFAKVLELVELSAGIDAYLGKVKLTIESVDVQALLKVRLDNVTAILDRVLTTIDRNPQIVQELASGVGSAVEGVGEGANEAASDIGSGTGSAVEDVGEGASRAIENVGQGAGSAVEDVGQGAGSAVEDVGGGAGDAAGEVGQGARQAAKQVGDSAGQVAQDATNAASEAAGQAGDAKEQAPEGAQQEDPGRTAQGTAARGAQVLSETTDEAGRTARRVADESGSIVEQTLTESGEVSEEAVVGEADTAGEAGEEKGEVLATPAAERKAEDLGVDLSQVEGTGSGGRITVKDVSSAANQGRSD